MTIESKFWPRVRILGPQECWLWQGMRNHDGYGRARFGKIRELTHRTAYRLVNGPIPNGMRVLHKCDNPACVNPAHLFLGTQADNIRDMDAKGRRKPARGERHGRAKLTAAHIAEIRSVGVPCIRLAAQYGVSKSLISAIRRNEVWR